MKIPLDVQYKEKDEVKKRGAQWCTKNKNWYLWDYKNIPDLSNWINPDLNVYITENIYLVSSIRTCWKCKKNTTVHSIGADKYIIKDENQWKFRTGFILFNNISNYTKNMINILKRTNGNFRLGFSKTINSKYMMNYCEHCKMPQGDNYLYEEIDSVFAPSSDYMASNITILKMGISLDLGIKGDSFTTYINGIDSNNLIYKNAKKQKLSKLLY